jgi:ketosteroid isomerase-like protein
MPNKLAGTLRPLTLAAAVLAAGFAGGWMMRGGAEAQEDATVLAETELGRFYEALAGRVALADVLGDAFQIIRTDGMRYDRDGYLARPPSYTDYKLHDIHAVQDGDLLTASYFSTVAGTFEDTSVASEKQPRLAVFAKADGEWKLQALANLGMGTISDPAAAGKAAVDAWVGAVAAGDTATLGKILAPEFQIIRSDGTAYDTAAYLQSELPHFPEPPKIGSLVVTGHGGYLVARYEIVSEVTLGGETEMRYGPRLTVFRKGPDGTWLVVAHANLAALTR